MRRSPAFLPLLGLGLALLPVLRAAADPPPPDITDPAVIAVAPVGRGARGLAVDGETGRVYVANWLEFDVSVIEPDGTLVTRIPTPSRVDGWGPEAMAVDEATNRVFAMDTSGDISVIDTGTNTVVGRIELYEGAGAWPMDGSIIVDHPARRVYSTLRFDDRRLAAIDADSLDVLSFFPSLPSSLQLGVDEKTHRVFVGSQASIIPIDGVSGEVLSADSIALSDGAFSIAVDSTVGRVYVTADANPSLFVIDGRKNELIENVDALACYYMCTFVAVDTVAHRVYQAGSGGLITIDSTTHEILARRNLPMMARGIAVDAARHRVYVTDEVNRRLLILDSAKLETSPSPAPGSLPIGGGPAARGRSALPSTVAGGVLLAAGVFLVSRSLRRAA
ncbi:MAG: YncE family protein [Dehalococcoidia bacterium]|nr:YncE family protein [Dehalococcoidia bacterium]